MNMAETANMIQALQAAGFTAQQINDFILSVEGRITIEEFEKRYKQESGK